MASDSKGRPQVMVTWFRKFLGSRAEALPVASLAPMPEVAVPPQRSAVLATMSHELRTPINGIVGYAELLLSPQVEAGSPRARRDYAEAILDSARDLQVLVDDLLDITRVQNNTLTFHDQDHDFGEMVEMVARSMRDEAEAAGASIVARLVPGISVQGDPRRLQQAIRNLLSNAIKFSPDGGIVNVEMQRSSAGHLVLAVRDAGIGIAAEDMARVFEPFVQVDSGATRRFGGTGVGLAIARHIAERHDGSIALSSAPGAGTEARLILPANRVTWPRIENRAVA